MSTKTVIEELVSVIGFDVDGAALSKAIRGFTNLHFLAKDVASAFRQIGSLLLDPLKSTVNFGEAAALTSKRLGLTAEGFQELSAEAKLFNVDVGAVTNGLERLGRSAYLATRSPTSSQAKAFGELGVRVTEAGGKLRSNDKLFADAVDKLSRITSQGKQTALAFQLMGRGAGQLLPLIQAGPGYFKALAEEIKKTGAIMSDDQVEAARQVGFWFKIAEMHAQGFERRLGTGLFPIASQLIGTFLNLADANRKWINTKIDKAAGYATEAIKLLYYAVRGVAHLADLAADAFGGWHNVLIAVTGVLGFAFLAAVGQATLAIGRFAIALLSLGIVPALIGALVVGIAIIVDDVTSAHGAIEKLSMMNVEDSPILKSLQVVANVVLSIRDAFREIGKSNFLVRSKSEVDAQKAADENAEDQAIAAGEQIKDWLTRPLWGQGSGAPGFDYFLKEAQKGRRRPTTSDFVGPQLPGGAGQSTEERRQLAIGQVRLEQHFHGKADPEVVKQAAKEGVSLAGDKLRVTHLHNAGAQSGSR